MIQMFFGTQRLACHALKNSAGQFRRILTEDDLVRRFFHIEDVNEFLNSLESSECFPCGVYKFSSGKAIGPDQPLVGYINGYIYSTGELLIEFFIAEKYRQHGYASELLNSYLLQCRKIGFHSFRFEVEDDNTICKSFMKSFGARRCESDDFSDASRHFCVYKITY